MGLLNALSFAWNNIKTDLFLHGPGDANITDDLVTYYGLATHPQLNIQLMPKTKGLNRSVYKASLAAIRDYCESGEDVLVMTREVGILASLIWLKRKYPNLTVLHEVHDYYGSVKHLPDKGFSDYRRMLSERISFPYLDGLICLTEYQRALYQQWLPQLAITVQPLGGQKNEPTPTINFDQRRHKRRVAYIGHLHSYKGLNLILELAQQLRGKDIEIVCYGGHEQKNRELSKRAKQQGISDLLTFVPFLSPKELNDVLVNDISIGIVPLQDTYYSRYLTCPVKALDFMANGLPVIGSDIPCVKDVFANSGVLIPSADAKAYANNIISILEDDEKYTALSKLSLNRASAISWTNRSRAIMDFVERR